MQSSNYHRHLEWVDISKGIAITLMVIGHSSIPRELNRFIFSFHMPFFFIISALFTNWEKESFQVFAIRKAKILLIPFIIYSAINLSILPWATHVNYSHYLQNWLLHGWGGIALWFVPVFFLSLIICKITRHKFLVIGGLVFLTIGVMFAISSFDLQWTISSVPLGASLMMWTRYFKKEIRNWVSSTSLKQWMIILPICLIISLYISNRFKLDMCSNYIIPAVPILMGVISGTLLCIGVSQLIERIEYVGNILSKIGKNTYEIMALSQVTIIATTVYLPDLPLLRYLIMVIILIVVTYLRKAIEGRFSNIEPI